MARNGVGAYKEAAGKEDLALQQGSEEIANVLESLKPPVTIDGGEVADNIKEYQGKYVDIGLDTNGNDDVDDWELFYAENDRIFLIAADYVPTDTLEKNWRVIGSGTKLDGGGFKKHATYSYNVYWPSAPTSFFEELADLSLVKHTGYDLNDNKGKTNSNAVSQLLDTVAWSGIKEAASADKQDCIDFVIGGPTLEMWCAAWNEAVEGDTKGFVTIDPDPQTDGTGYKVKHGTTSSTYLYMNGTTSSLTADQRSELENTYKTFFPHTGTSAWNNCYGYWLASPSAVYSNSLMFVNFNGSVDNYDYNYSYYGVRPVVCLTSGVQLAETFEGSNIYNISK